jgi:hypothetical protein
VVQSSREGRKLAACATSDGADRPSGKPARRDAAEGRHLLDRILNTPRLEQVVPRLQPDVLHRVIQSCGLEDCGELVALATPEQLARIFDLDLWRAGRPGMDEQFDADRFGLWIEVLVESGAEAAAQKLAGMDVDLVVAGLARHVLVYDRAAVTPYETLDGEQIEVSRADDNGLTFDMGGYLVVARRADSWEAIIEVLLALGAGHRQYLHQVMAGCRTLSNSGREIDGLDDLLAEEDQVMFDLAVDREVRREKQGYVTPAEARAFLQMARELGPRSEPMPAANPLTRAYFRALDDRRCEQNRGIHRRDAENAENTQRRVQLFHTFDKSGAEVHGEPGLLAAGLLAGSGAPDASEDIAEVVAAVCDLLLQAGVLEQAPRALLGGSERDAQRLGRSDRSRLIKAHMQFVLDHDQAAYSRRSQELAYLANTLMAGCAIQARPFTAQEASDAAVAVCNLGLENWGLENWGLENGPAHWLPANATSLPGSFLVDHDLVSVFQVGWAVLHTGVSMYAAEQLIRVLTRIRCDDREIQMWLDGLRITLGKHWRARAPWRARDALDVIAILDMPSWAVLLALIDECPVLHACVGASKDSPTLSVSAHDFVFISENSQIASVREFMQSLPERLRC